MADEILKFDGDPIRVAPGPLTDGTKQRIEQSVTQNLSGGSKIAVIAMLDAETGERLDGKLGVAVRVGKHFVLSAEAQHTFGGKSSGFLGLVAEF